MDEVFGRYSAAAEFTVGQLGEPPLDQVEPGRAGRGEVQMEPGMSDQPGLDLRSLVGGVVVAHQVQIQLRRSVGIDSLEEFQELLVSVTALVTTDDLPVAMSSAANRLVVPCRT